MWGCGKPAFQTGLYDRPKLGEVGAVDLPPPSPSHKSLWTLHASTWIHLFGWTSATDPSGASQTASARSRSCLPTFNSCALCRGPRQPPCQGRVPRLVWVLHPVSRVPKEEGTPPPPAPPGRAGRGVKICVTISQQNSVFSSFAGPQFHFGFAQAEEEKRDPTQTLV